MMKKENIKQLAVRYENICNEYVKTFCELYELHYEQDCWVGGDIGSIVCLGDYFFDFQGVVKYAVDNGLNDFSDLMEWYYYTTWAASFNQPVPNFGSWSKGCPRATKEQQQHLINLKREFDETAAKYAKIF